MAHRKSNYIWRGKNKSIVTYFVLGVIHVLVLMKGRGRNIYTRVDGDATCEPTDDLITLLGPLVDVSRDVCVPVFYEDVLPLSAAELVRLHRVYVDDYKY